MAKMKMINPDAALNIDPQSWDQVAVLAVGSPFDGGIGLFVHPSMTATDEAVYDLRSLADSWGEEPADVIFVSIIPSEDVQE